jgi:hypothetical protein
LCDKELPNPCATLPCKNNADCINDNGGTCVCKGTFTGKLCEIEILLSTTTKTTTTTKSTTTNVFNNCSPDPCINGFCVDDGIEFFCLCDSLFTGDFCETAIVTTTTTKPTTTTTTTTTTKDSCAPNPCNNGGFCVVNGATYFCLCIGQFTGPKCESALTG